MTNVFPFLRTQFIEEFVEALSSTPVEALASPSYQLPAVGYHMDRFINNKMFASIEDKLAHLSQPKLANMDTTKVGGVTTNGKSVMPVS